MNLWSPGGVAESPQGDDLYASLAGRPFCAYASSRALLHVGSLSLWDRQLSNAPPLLLSPAGLASRRGPIPKRTWGCAPRPPCRRYALKVPAAHFMWKLWMVRGRGGWGAGRRLAEGAVLQTIKYLLNCHLSSPPQRRGQGWWFALPRFSAGAIKKRRRLLGSVSVRSTDDALHRSYPALQATKGGSSRGNFPLDPVLLPFAGAKGRPRRRGVLARPCIRPTPPLGAYKFGPKILLLLSFIEKYPPPTGEMKLRHGFCRQSLRLISFATSLYTREAFADRRLQTGLRRVGEMK